MIDAQLVEKVGVFSLHAEKPSQICLLLSFLELQIYIDTSNHRDCIDPQEMF